jgi:hypothetical protein
MRHASSSRFSYRNVLIAAGLAAALGVGTAFARPLAAAAPQPLGGDQSPEGSAAGHPVPAPIAAGIEHPPA